MEEGAATTIGRFHEAFGRAPTHVVRAPGRVNLIGEHIDYHDLTVAPVAIDRAVHVLFAPTAERRVRVHTSEEASPPEEVELSAELEPLAAGDWRNYVRSAVVSLAADTRVDTGMDALVVSDVPVAAGLSSSSALVVGVGLALARANGHAPGRRAFAEQMAAAERFTGTAGGGMDQAACLMSRVHQVSFLSFAPLSVEYVPFPDRLRLLVTHSGERAEKSGALQAEYNERRETGRGALEAVAAALGRPGATYGSLLAEFSEGVLLEAGAGALETGPLSRFRHVVTEAGRVSKARRALEEGDDTGLGEALNRSHESLRDAYAVSTDALDGLVRCARDAGALGARLTGAGFGGAIIALATRATVDRVGAALAEAVGDDEASVMCVTPSEGAAVLEL